MNVKILIGTLKQPREDGTRHLALYVGEDGVKLEQAAVEAAKSGRFGFIGRMTNPSCAPMPLVYVEPKKAAPVEAVEAAPEPEASEVPQRRGKFKAQ